MLGCALSIEKQVLSFLEENNRLVRLPSSVCVCVCVFTCACVAYVQLFLRITPFEL
jgi:hypothetical protein